MASHAAAAAAAAGGEAAAASPTASPAKRAGASAAAAAKKRGKRPQTDRGKGLRHFAMCVCKKVQEKGTTTYNEVAEELVQEHLNQLTAEAAPGEAVSEPKNIRRRVYDAINVLMAMEIIAKDQKLLKWKGLPTNSAQEYKQYEEMRRNKEEQIAKARAHLRDLLLQQIAFKNLIKRNEQRQLEEGDRSGLEHSIQLPFIVINTDKDAVIDCQMEKNRSEFIFDFDRPFEVHDDVEILKHMGLTLGIEDGSCTDEQLELAKTLVPAALTQYLDEMVAEARNPKPAAAATAAASGGAAAAAGEGAVEGSVATAAAGGDADDKEEHGDDGRPAAKHAKR